MVNISSDAAVSAYENWGAYGASKAALQHLSRVWDLELKSEGVGVVSVDPGDMDTPLHALAIPGADRSGLRRPEDSAREIADLIVARTAARPASTFAQGATVDKEAGPHESRPAKTGPYDAAVAH